MHEIVEVIDIHFSAGIDIVYEPAGESSSSSMS